MANPTKPTSSKFQTQLQSLSDGLGNNVAPTVTSFPVAGATLSRAEVITKLKAALIIFAAVLTTRDAYRAAVAAKAAAAGNARILYDAIIAYLKLVLGPNAQATLSALGVAPPKVRKAATAETKAIANVKRNATRTARGIKGKKQRSSITATPQPTLQVLDGQGQPLTVPVAPPASSPTTLPTPPVSPTTSPPGTSTPKV
jgi:hypothetical protein